MDILIQLPLTQVFSLESPNQPVSYFLIRIPVMAMLILSDLQLFMKPAHFMVILVWLLPRSLYEIDEPSDLDMARRLAAGLLDSKFSVDVLLFNFQLNLKL